MRSNHQHRDGSCSASPAVQDEQSARAHSNAASEKLTYLEERDDSDARVPVKEAHIARDGIPRRDVDLGVQHP